MRWKPFHYPHAKGPNAWELRIIRRFLFFPKTLPIVGMYDGTGNYWKTERPLETRWLEFSKILQWWGISSEKSKWIDDSWLDPLGEASYELQESWRKNPDSLWYEGEEQ